ncbi:hypothetical protein K2F54_02665 [Cryobacterium sp. 1639]|uniref:hypothetical protein n=1 Tax=Cryobacterium inferilacus TaxID=2866629 RepID=UPI001C730C7C|nr:hypothetical protein [Cryobacterium sp. 1639]MBX0298874.1 hypothetical protein [Cryobacterium sp. 1639]
MTSEYEHPDAAPGLVLRPSGRRRAAALAGAFGIAAAVIAVGLWFAPSVRAYSGVEPWVVIGVLAFVFVLGGAALLAAATVSAPAPTVTHGTRPPEPQAFPDGSFPDGSFPDGSFPAGTLPNEAPSRVAPDQGRPGGTAPEAPTGRLLTLLGALLGTVGLAVGALSLALAVLLPTPTESIMVQFTDLVGRVQLEYCPTLPASFAGTASHDDLAGAATILPVKVSAETCGNSDYTDGVWIYLNRTAVTVSDRP